jgi:uncharacterized protein HemY
VRLPRLLLTVLLFPLLLLARLQLALLLFPLLLLLLLLLALLFFLLGALSQYRESSRTTNRWRRNDCKRKAKQKRRSASDCLFQESVCRGEERQPSLRHG